MKNLFGVSKLTTTMLLAALLTTSACGKGGGGSGSGSGSGSSANLTNVTQAKFAEDSTKLTDAQAKLDSDIGLRFERFEARAGAPRGGYTWSQSRLDSFANDIGTGVVAPPVNPQARMLELLRIYRAASEHFLGSYTNNFNLVHSDGRIEPMALRTSVVEELTAKQSLVKSSIERLEAQRN